MIVKDPTMSPKESPSKTLKTDETDNILQQALLLAEIGMDLKERYISGEKYVCYLKTILSGADKAITALRYISKSSLKLAEKLVTSAITTIDVNDKSNLKAEYEKLLGIIEKQISDYDDIKDLENLIDPTQNLSHLSEKIKFLDSRNKSSENNLFFQSSSSRSVKADVDEKYPENLSRESLIDLNSIVNLPPVPEDIFTSFSGKPIRSSSLSSLKSMRKVKLFLQKAENSDDDDSSDPEEHDFTKFYGDNDENKLSVSHSSPKKLLGNIKEESQGQD